MWAEKRLRPLSLTADADVFLSEKVLPWLQGPKASWFVSRKRTCSPFFFLSFQHTLTKALPSHFITELNRLSSLHSSRIVAVQWFQPETQSSETPSEFRATSLSGLSESEACPRKFTSDSPGLLISPEEKVPWFLLHTQDGFKDTFFCLRQKVTADSHTQHSQYMLMIVLKINDSLIGFSVDEQGLIHQRIYMNTQERGGMTLQLCIIHFK